MSKEDLHKIIDELDDDITEYIKKWVDGQIRIAETNKNNSTKIKERLESAKEIIQNEGMKISGSNGNYTTNTNLTLEISAGEREFYIKHKKGLFCEYISIHQAGVIGRAFDEYLEFLLPEEINIGVEALRDDFNIYKNEELETLNEIEQDINNFDIEFNKYIAIKKLAGV